MAQLSLRDLPGWADDDHAAALTTYLKTAPDDLNARSALPRDACSFFEDTYAAELVAGSAVLTGYFEPVYEGSLYPDAACQTPVHALPEGWAEGQAFAARAEIEDEDLLAGRELAWLKSPLDAYLLQVQGSGRIRTAEGSELRVGYAGKNGQPYVSLGKLLVEHGELAADDVSMQAIYDWFEKDPARAMDYLRRNPSYVFFQRLDDLPPDQGPIGTSGVPLTAHRSIAVDPEHIALGSLVYLAPLDASIGPRLCVAQDTGGAIKGPGRTDLFCGTGDGAGAEAGPLLASTAVYRLVPKSAGA
ncbi:murein transglycosylase A [Vannielia litorea]|uniref:murein transglycosylase A n=1 Tax=Vannielia litorea TaxID=1217970 RepID=UPI001BCEBBBB